MKRRKTKPACNPTSRDSVVGKQKSCQMPLANGCAKMSTILAAAGVFLVFFLATLFVTKEMIG
jgi:hypothetical protein